MNLNDIKRAGLVSLMIIGMIIFYAVFVWPQSKQIILTEVSKPIFTYGEGIDFSDSMKVEYGKFRLRFVPIGAGKKTASVLLGINNYGDVWASTNLRRYKVDDGIKEEIIVKDSLAPKKFRFLIKGHKATISGKDITFGHWGTIPAPWARDDNGIYHNAVQSLSGDTLIIGWSKSDSADIIYPLLIDPTLTINDTAGLGGWRSIRMQNGAASGIKNTQMIMRATPPDSVFNYINYPIAGIVQGLNQKIRIDSAFLRFKVVTYTSAVAVRAKLVRQVFRDSTGTSMTGAVYSTGNNWTRTMALDTSNDIYGIKSDTIRINAADSYLPDSSYHINVKSLISRVAGVDSIHRHLGLMVTVDSIAAGDGVTFHSPSAANTYNRPILQIYYTSLDPNPVILPDSINFSALTDSSFTIDSINHATGDTNSINLIALNIAGLWRDTSGTTVSKTTKYWRRVIDWQNHTFWGFRQTNVTKIGIYRTAADTSSDSIKVKWDSTGTFAATSITDSLSWVDSLFINKKFYIDTTLKVATISGGSRTLSRKDTTNIPTLWNIIKWNIFR